MNTYTRNELLDMFGYCFQVLKAVSDLENAIKSEQNKAFSGVMENYKKLKKIYNIGVLAFIIFCIILGIFQGTVLSFWQYLIVIAISYGLFQLLFSPFVMVVKFFYKHYAKKRFISAKNNDVSNSYRQKGKELLQDAQFLAYKKEIPATFFNQNDLYLLYSYLENYRADNFKEAANLLAEEKHRERIEYSQEVMKKSISSIQSNTRYQSVMQTIQLLETKSIHQTLKMGLFEK